MAPGWDLATLDSAEYLPFLVYLWRRALKLRGHEDLGHADQRYFSEKIAVRYSGQDWLLQPNSIFAVEGRFELLVHCIWLVDLDVRI